VIVMLLKILLFLMMVSSLCILSCAAESEDTLAVKRSNMVDEQVKARGVTDENVLAAMLKVPRDRFVPPAYEELAYADFPLAIGEGQTISQPYIVAFMTESLDLKPGDRVLEIGTGSGYQAAILAEIVAEVFTIEIIPELGSRAKNLLAELGYDTVTVKIGDGYEGWEEMAPFDAVIVTCAPQEIPEALVNQLKEGGRLIIPVGPVGAVQELVRGTKVNGRIEKKDVLPVRFVPMVKAK